MEQVELERRLAQSPLLAGVSLPAEQARVQSFPAGHILSDRPGGVPSVGLIRDAGLSLRYAELCNQKLQFLLRRIELLTMQSCRGRVIAHLLAGQDRNGCVKPTGSREDLARQLGVSRAALFRELAALQSMGVLRSEGNLLTVLDTPALEKLLYHPSRTK